MVAFYWTALQICELQVFALRPLLSRWLRSATHLSYPGSTQLPMACFLQARFSLDLRRQVPDSRSDAPLMRVVHIRANVRASLEDAGSDGAGMRCQPLLTKSLLRGTPKVGPGHSTFSYHKVCSVIDMAQCPSGFHAAH